MRYAHLAEDIKKDAVKLLDGENDYGQKVDKNKRSADAQISQPVDFGGGDDGTRTRDLWLDKLF